MTRRRIAASLVAASAVFLVGCNRTVNGSGHVVAHRYRLAPFEHVIVSGPFDVRISEGATTELTIRTDDNLRDDVNVEAAEETLHIQLQPRVTVTNATLEADIVAPLISTLDVTSAGRVRLVGHAGGGEISMSAGGGSRIEGRADANTLHVEADDGSAISLTGRAAELSVDGSSGSRLDVSGLQATELKLHLTHGSQAAVWATGTMKADLSGGSHATYRGSPRFEEKKLADGSALSAG
jgi:predicted small secreted protein